METIFPAKRATTAETRVNPDEAKFKPGEVQRKSEEGSPPEYDGTIFSLFSILDSVFKENRLPDNITRKAGSVFFSKSSDSNDMGQARAQGELFTASDESESEFYPAPCRVSGAVVAYKYFEPCRNSFSGQEIIKYSGKAYKDILYAWMSELPIEREIIHFAWKIVSAGRTESMESMGSTKNNNCKKAKSSAERARCDLADINVKKVLDAASRARKESHFLMGILRFSVGSSGAPVARCSPDYFILPTLAYHFTLRFGKSAWAIIDEKRNISLMRAKDGEAKLFVFDPLHPWFKEETGDGKESFDDWEKMWKNYHSSINNESRANPNLQRRFIPVRYWKYLPELQCPPST